MPGLPFVRVRSVQAATHSQREAFYSITLYLHDTGDLAVGPCAETYCVAAGIKIDFQPQGACVASVLKESHLHTRHGAVLNQCCPSECKTEPVRGTIRCNSKAYPVSLPQFVT